MCVSGRGSYTSFHFRIDNVSGLLNYGPGGSNLLAVQTSSVAPEGWWYDGGGIPRHVWLVQTPAVHIAPWGVFALPAITGPVTHGQNYTDTATSSVTVATEVVNANMSALNSSSNVATATATTATVVTAVTDPKTGGTIGTTTTSGISLGPPGSVVVVCLQVAAYA